MTDGSGEQRVAWVTGGGSGIGRALARELARRGHVAVVSGRRTDRLDAVVAEVEAEGGRAAAIPCDVTSEADVAGAVRSVVERFGRLDVAVANAGYAASGRIEDTDLAVWRRQLDVNVLGVVATARHALPELRRTRGRFAIVGSVAAFLGLPGQGPYSASKAAVASLGATIAAELAGSGASCTTIHPGFVSSEIVQVDDLGRYVGGRKDRRPKRLLWKPEDAARVMADAIDERQRELVFTGHGRVAAALGRHAPGVVQALISRTAKPSAPLPRPEELGALPLAPAEPIELDRDPGHLPIFARAAWRAPSRPQGTLPDGAAIPALSTRLRGVRVPREKVAAYRAVCHLPGDDGVLPLPLPEILYFGMLGTIATDERFPLSPFGLIHIGQTMRAHAPVAADLPLDLEARVAAARRTEKGYEIDLGLAASHDGAPLWEATTTLLSRAPAARSGARREKRPPFEAPGDAREIEVPADTGRAYARVSGDWNPHHLWKATARPLGFDRPIAHGMWTLARLIGLLPGTVDTTVGEVAATFHRPILLPARIGAAVTADGDGWTLAAWSPGRGSPHLRGTYRP